VDLVSAAEHSPSPPDSRDRPSRFGVVDIETSGLLVDRHRILQLALVTVENGAITDRWVSYVRLRWPLQRVGPRRIHGITRRDLRGAPRLPEALTELGARLEGSVFTAHNAAFDAAFLRAAAHQADVELALGPTLCTLRMSRRLDPDRAHSHRLPDVCTRYGVAHARPHDALEDALATACVLPHLLAAHGVECAEDLAPFYVDTPPASTSSASSKPASTSSTPR